MSQLAHQSVDLLIIGGGIHGCAAAAHAAARGLSVLLVEKDDLASKTSSASTKLIHGGLRYLEHAEFRLVKQALTARAALLKNAPHLVHPLTFVIPHRYRHPWKIRLGLKLYDRLSSRQSLPKSRHISRDAQPELFSSLDDELQHAELYVDAQTDDARLTIENALQAKQLGAQICPQTALTAAHYEDQSWQITLSPKQGSPYTVQAKAMINTSGAWVNQLHQILGLENPHEISWVKGSHLLLPALYPGDQAYLLQHTDQRIIFCIPYHGYTLVGTTDQSFEGDLNHIQMDEHEADYLCQIVKHYFKPCIRSQDIFAHYSGIRTLIHHPNQALHALKREACISQPHPTVASLYGGKLTTHQLTAATLVDTLKPIFPQMRAAHLLDQPFPGAIHHNGLTYEAAIEQLETQYAFLPATLIRRYVSQYGTRTFALLENCRALSDLGEEVLPSLFEREIEFLRTEEWAQSAEDILWRRTKLGLQLPKMVEKKLNDYLLTVYLR